MKNIKSAAALLAAAIVLSASGAALTVSADVTDVQPSAAAAASVSGETSGNFSYEVENGSVTITNIHVSEEKLTIPKTIDGKTVTKIGGYVVEYNDRELVKEITLPDTITSIENAAFYKCTNLEKINFPAGLTTIPQSSFGICGFKTLNIPATVKKVGYMAFYQNDALTEVTVSAEAVDNSAFWESPELKKVTFMKSVKEIDNYALFGCPNVTVYCYAGAEGERFAKYNNLPIVYLSDSGSTPVKNTNILGDVDGDSTVTAVDAMAILRCGVGAESFNNDQKKLGDVNSDSSVDSLDALAVLRYSVGYTENEKIGKKIA